MQLRLSERLIDPKSPERRPRRAAYALPTLFTAANVFFGFLAITKTIEGTLRANQEGNVSIPEYALAAQLIGVAVAADGLDGRIARMTNTVSDFGRELDSLADVISFGVAPAAIAYGCGMQGLFDRIVLVFFVACGVSRLARYNVTAEKLSAGSDKVAYFEGTPIPTSMVLVALLWAAAAQGALGESLWGGVWWIAGFRLHPLVLLFAVSGSLMVSRIRIPKF